MASKDAKYDLIIIGGGAAAFSAAIKADMHNVKTALVERAALGETCVNVGCVPSKNLLGTAEVLHSVKELPYPYNILPCDSGFDFAKTISDKDRLVRSLHKQKYQDVVSGLKNIELIKASAAFVSKKRIRLDNGRTLEADKFILAAGSSPSVPPFKGIDEVDYLTSNEALSLKAVFNDRHWRQGFGLGIRTNVC